MPRVTPAHEQAVRQRMIHRSRPVERFDGRRSDEVAHAAHERRRNAEAARILVVLHVIKNKEELFLVACTCDGDAQKAELRLRMAELGSVTDRLRAAVDFAIDSAVTDGLELGVRMHSWTMAKESPELRQVLWDRRTEMVAFSRLVLAEALVRGELPGWIDADGIASAFVTLIDGFAVRAVESGSMPPEDARREAYALLELLVGAPPEAPEAVARLRSENMSRPS